MQATPKSLQQYEGNDDLPKTYHSWIKPKKIQAPCFKEDAKANQCKGLARTVHFVVAMEYITNPWYHVLYK